MHIKSQFLNLARTLFVAALLLHSRCSSFSFSSLALAARVVAFGGIAMCSLCDRVERDSIVLIVSHNESTASITSSVCASNALKLVMQHKVNNALMLWGYCDTSLAAGSDHPL